MTRIEQQPRDYPDAEPSVPECPRILILTSSHLCRNPRVLKEATTLGAAGYDVTVMSISVQKRFEDLDCELMRGRPFRRVTVNYVANTLGARMSGFLQRAATWGARHLRSKFKVETAQSLGPASVLLRRARRFPADLTIVHTEIPLWAAQYLIRDGRRVAVDIEDWYSEDLLDSDRQSRPLGLLRQAEEFALRNAAYSSTTSHAMSAGLASAYRCNPPIVLHNSFPLQPSPSADLPRPAVPSFIWFSQTIGPGRGLEIFFDAWSLMRLPSQVCLLGDLRPGYRETLLARVPVARRGYVAFMPAVPPNELPAKLAEFDIGLALEPRLPLSRDLTITNKILQYMNAGLAIVATGTAGQTEVMTAAPDCGLLISGQESDKYAAQLDDLVGNPTRLRAAQLAARAAAVREFCWEQETPRLLAAVATALR